MLKDEIDFIIYVKTLSRQNDGQLGIQARPTILKEYLHFHKFKGSLYCEFRELAIGPGFTQVVFSKLNAAHVRIVLSKNLYYL